MAKEFTSSPEVEEIAERLIEILKPELEGLEIRYIFCSENPKKDGQEKAGLMRKITGLTAYLAGNADGFFVLETGKPAFDVMTANGKIAYVHHELCHPGVDENGNLTLYPHDIEEFTEIALTHGSYHDGLTIFGAALQKGDGDESSRKELIDRILNG
jgi:predicted metallopeptidase